MNALTPSREACRTEWPLLIVILLAIAVRVIAIAASSASLQLDPDSYRLYAQTLIDHGTFLRHDQPSAWRAPLYPLVLAVCLLLPGVYWWWIAVLHVVCGALTTLFVVKAGQSAGIGRSALVAGAVIALDPLLVHQCTQVMTETLAVLLTALVLWQIGNLAAGRWGRGVLVGAALAACALARPGLLVWAGLVLIALGWHFRRDRQLHRLAPVVVGFIVVLCPWAVRNFQQLGQPVLTTTHGGYTLLLANNPQFYEFLREPTGRKTWNSRPFVEAWADEKTRRQISNELDENRLAYQLGWQNIRSAPGDFVSATVYRVTSFWRLAPLTSTPAAGLSQQLTGLGIAFWNFGVFALALFGLLAWEQQRKQRANRDEFVIGVALLLVLSLVLVHLFYWTDMRMRAPAVPALALLVALGWRWLAGKRRTKAEQR